MQSCTRARFDTPLGIDKLGSLALDLPAPQKAAPTGHTIAVIGGGPAGLSAAWQLGLKGHSVDLYEATDKLGGKLELCIPRERLPHEILEKELSRFREIGVNIHLEQTINQKKFNELYKEHDILVVACGAHKPRIFPFPMMTGLLWRIFPSPSCGETGWASLGPTVPERPPSLDFY